jgi:hypothetical protein
MKTARRHTKLEELAHRSSNDIEVVLFWGPARNQIVVEVLDHGSGVAFEVAVPPECALDAFHHPYAYASSLGVEYEVLLPNAA